MRNRNKNPSECIEALKKSNASSKQIKVNTSDIEVYHVESVSEHLIKLIDAKTATEAVLAGGAVTSTVMLNCNQFSKKVTEGFALKQYTTILKIGEILLAIDNNSRCRSSLANACKASGQTFYKDDLLSDIALARELDAGRKKPVIIRYHMDLRLGIALRVCSEMKFFEDMTAIDEWGDKNLSLGDWIINEKEQILEFEASPVNGFIPIVRCMQSLAGEYLFHREYCVREENAVSAIALEGTSSIDDVKKFANRSMNGLAPNISSRLAKTLGKKRGKEFKSLIQTAYISGGEDAAVRAAMSYLDKANFNSATPRKEAEEELGYIFMGR